MNDTSQASLEYLIGRPLALDPRAVARLTALRDTAAPNVRAALGGLEDSYGRDRRIVVNGVAVIPVRGMVTLRSAWWGTSLEEVQRLAAEHVADPAVRAIVLDIDSPGGTVDGLPEAHAALMAVRREKPITALVNTLAASAAYYLASAATEVVISESGEAGSIGVFMLYINEERRLEAAGVDVEVIRAGARKVEANPWEALTDEARAELKAAVEHYRGLFVRDVAKGRGRSRAMVGGPAWGSGLVLRSGDAVRAGMADRVGTLADVVGGLASGRTRNGRTAAGAVPVARLALNRAIELEELA